ncbi:hypothetical protein ACLB2K_009960 [Fragaria x ananassa]
MVEISELNDDLIGHILKRVSEPGGRKRFSQVCKQWLKVEGQTRTSLNLLRLSFLRRVLPRFPNLVSFRTGGSFLEEADLEFIAKTCPNLETIDLNTEEFESRSLSTNGLSKLSKVSVRGRCRVDTVRWLHKLAHDNLTYLDLGYCWFVDETAAEAIGQLCTCLSYLNLRYSNVSDNGLRLLAHGSCSKAIKTLVLAKCYHITDSGLAHLRNMQCLEELDLEGNVLTDTGVIAAISGNQSLQKLNLSWLRNVSDRSMVFVAENCPNLKFLDLRGTRVTGAGIRAFSGHMCLESLVLRLCYAFSWRDVEHMVLGCPSLKSFALSEKIIKKPIPERLSKIVTLVDYIL